MLIYKKNMRRRAIALGILLHQALHASSHDFSDTLVEPSSDAACDDSCSSANDGWCDDEKLWEIYQHFFLRNADEVHEPAHRWHARKLQAMLKPVRLEYKDDNFEDEDVELCPSGTDCAHQCSIKKCFATVITFRRRRRH